MFQLMFCLVAVAAVAAVADIEDLRYDNDHNNNGAAGFSYSYEQSDGTRHENRGELRNAGFEDESLVFTGVYAWVGPGGVQYFVKYVADENNYQHEIAEGQDSLVPGHIVALFG